MWQVFLEKVANSGCICRKKPVFNVFVFLVKSILWQSFVHWIIFHKAEELLRLYELHYWHTGHLKKVWDQILMSLVWTWCSSDWPYKQLCKLKTMASHYYNHIELQLDRWSCNSKHRLSLARQSRSEYSSTHLQRWCWSFQSGTSLLW